MQKLLQFGKRGRCNFELISKNETYSVEYFIENLPENKILEKINSKRI
jgi:hypothetical protein